MAWKIFSIVLITLTTTSAYKFPYPAYYQQYQSRNYGASQYRRVDDGSLEQDFGRPGGYQERSAAYSQPNNRQLAETDYSQFYPSRPVERSIPFDYSQRKDQAVRVTPTSEDAQLRNGNSSFKILNNLSKTYPSLTNRRGVDTESAVVFPGPTSGTSEKEDLKPCGDLDICENSPDYPHEQVKALLAKVTDANIRFNLDVDVPVIAQRGSHGQEQPQSNQTQELCDSDPRIIYPDKVKLKSGKWVWIVNQDKTKIQGFRGVQCKKPNGKCGDIVFFPGNYRAYCEQKKMDRYMWALDETKTKMELVTVSWPSCCTCVLQPLL